MSTIQEPATDERWYYAKGKRKLGPFTLPQLRPLATAGKLKPTDMVLQVGTATWVSAISVADLYPVAQLLEPLASQPAAVDAMNEGQTTRLQICIDRLKGGDAAARNDLINCACDRLLRLTRKMLKSYPGVARWEQTGDVFQNASIRLCRALSKTAPESLKHFLNLAALHIRRELIDMARHHFGPEGAGAHHDTTNDRSENSIAGASETTSEPSKLAQWTQFHEQIDALPPDEREIFNLLWYHGVSQSEAATVLKLSERTLQRRWQSARLKIFEAMNGVLPE